MRWSAFATFWIMSPAWAEEAPETEEVPEAEETSDSEEASQPDALEIIVEAHRESPHAVRQVLDRERVTLTPGTHDDPFRLLQALPGVAMTPEYSPNAGEVAIRGAAPGDNRFFLDGVELPYLYHFNQYASVLHTRLLDELALYPSTFGAAYGNATGAVIDAKTVSDIPEEAEGGVNFNAIMLGGRYRRPLGEGKAISIAGRRSFLDWINGGSEGQYVVWPRFSDHFVRHQNSADPDHRSAWLLMGSTDRYDRYVGEPELLNPVEQEANPVFSFERGYEVVAWQRHDGGLDYERDAVVAFVYDRWNGAVPDAEQARTTYQLQYREDGLLRLGDDLQLAAGTDLQASRTHRIASTSKAWAELEREAPMLARGVSVDETLQRMRGGIYGELRIDSGPVRWLPGVRVDADSLSSNVTIDPRAGVQWRPWDQLAFRGAVGRYHRFPTIDQLSPETGDPTLTPARSDEIAAGMDGLIAGRWEMTADVYRKWMSNLIVEEVGQAPIGGADGDAYGVEIGSRYRLKERFFSWISVGIGESTRTVDGEVVPSDYDQPWRFSWVSSWTPTPKWNVGLRFRSAAGLPYTPIEDGLYDAATDSYDAELGSENSARLASYTKVDVHIERTWTVRKVEGTLYAEVWYVPEGNNVMYPAYRYDYDEMAYVAGPPFVPLLGVRGSF
jgi:outer membrane receptor protein involved in Fe transport